MDNQTLITLVAQIVSAHVSNNRVSTGDMSRLIEAIYGALANAGTPVPAMEAQPEPAVPVRSSLKRDSIVCLECGRKMKMLKRHLYAYHNLTPSEYRARWDLAADYPMIAADYAAKRAEQAVKIGLGRRHGIGGKRAQSS